MQKMGVVRTCLIFVFLSVICDASSQGELQPLNFNVSEGADPVVFTCSSETLRFFTVDNTDASDGVLRSDRGVSVNVVNSSVTRLSIEPRLINNNVTITCFVVGPPGSSLEAVLKVQGRLSAPPDLVIVESQSPGLQELSWTPPFTLDLTDQDPDILGYRVCFTLPSSNSDMEAAQCSTTQELTYSFINISVLLNFSVAALSPGGVGFSGFAVHQPCNDAAFVNASVLELEAAQSGENYSVSATIQVPPQTQCYDVYQLELEPVSSSSLGSFKSPLLLPAVSNEQLQVHHQFSELTENTIYLTVLTAVNSNRKKVVAENISLSTYDVQGVSVQPSGSGMVEVSCSFITNSVAQGCQVTVCMLDMDQTMRNCITKELTRNGNSATFEFMGLPNGTYVITRVADVEENGNTSEVSDLSVFGLQAFNLTGVSGTTEGASSNSPPVSATGGLLNPRNGDNTGVIIGAVVGGTAAAILLFLIIVIACYICIEKKNSSSYTLGTTPRPQKKKKFVDSEVVVDGQQQTPTGPSKGLTDSSTVEVDLGVEFGEPLSANFYDLPDVEKVPSVPPKKSVGHVTSPEVLSPPSGWEGPLENLSQYDVQEVSLTAVTPTVPGESSIHFVETEANNEHRSVSPTPVKVDLGDGANSQSPPTQVPPTYAEVMHVTTPKSNKRPHDKTSVYYSEIKLENSPPNIPKKQSKIGSAASSSSSLNGVANELGHSESTDLVGQDEFNIRSSQTDETITEYQV